MTSRADDSAALARELAEARAEIERLRDLVRFERDSAGLFARQLNEADREIALHREGVRVLTEQVRLLVHASDTEARVTFDEALAGVPVYGLPPTPRRTLQEWGRKHAKLLGIKRGADVSQQRLLVAGLLLRHANPKRKARPPQARGGLSGAIRRDRSRAVPGGRCEP